MLVKGNDLNSQLAHFQSPLALRVDRCGDHRVELRDTAIALCKIADY